MKRVIVGFLLVLWLLFVGGAGAQNDCQEAWVNCFWRAPPGLEDIMLIIAVYSGDIEPYSICDCGPRGDHFPVCVDVNGNCIPLELSDVIYMIGMYGGDVQAIMCPDCS
jgi:hypothetical protein